MRQTLSRTFVRSSRMRSHSPDLRVFVERILAGDPTMRAIESSDEPLTDDEKVDMLVELCASVDENAHRRAEAESGSHAIYLRTEEWHKVIDGVDTIGSLDVLYGEMVVITHELLEHLLVAAGWEQRS